MTATDKRGRLDSHEPCRSLRATPEPSLSTTADCLRPTVEPYSNGKSILCVPGLKSVKRALFCVRVCVFLLSTSLLDVGGFSCLRRRFTNERRRCRCPLPSSGPRDLLSRRGGLTKRYRSGPTIFCLFLVVTEEVTQLRYCTNLVSFLRSSCEVQYSGWSSSG